jgi:hypothetical protein
MSDSNSQGNTCGDGQPRTNHSAPEALREVWLDLEDTVVTPIVRGWHDFELLNIEKVKAVLADIKPHFVNIFSFAIHDSHQLSLFSKHTRPHLEQALGVEFSIVLTVDEHIIPVCCKVTGLRPSTVDFQEMSNFWGKQGAFRLFMRARAESLLRHDKRVTALLLDDAVYDEVIEWPGLGTHLTILNIDNLLN